MMWSIRGCGWLHGAANNSAVIQYEAFNDWVLYEMLIALVAFSIGADLLSKL